MVMLVVKVVLVTIPDHMVDHKWSVGVPGLSSYIWVSKVVIFHREHGGGADDGTGDHS